MRILMVARTRRWFGPPRLLHALSVAGATVASLAPADALLGLVRRCDRHFAWSDATRMDWSDLLTAIEAFQPERLLAADDPAVDWLLTLAERHDLPPPLQAALSVWTDGDSTRLRRAGDKLEMTQLAAGLGVSVPTTSNLDHDADAGLFVHRHGWPVVVKARRGFAGIEVFPCATLRELRHALAQCPRERGRLIQRFHAGATWMSLVVADRGRLLGQLSLVKESQFPAWVGPSCTVRSAFDAELLAASERIVAALGFTGFGSLDFLVAADGRKYLLEFNPRPVPASHLGAAFGADLVTGFVTGGARDPRHVTIGRRIALFPQELMRRPDGSGLAGCRHDVPWDEPELLSALCALLEPEARRHIDVA